MKHLKTMLRLSIRNVLYRLVRLGWIRPINPFNVTYSVTNLCNSRCQTCLIWKVYRDDRSRYKDELTLDQVEKILKTLGKTLIFNISGGEPFLRRDLPQIVEYAIRYCDPAVVHIPTNCVSVERTLKGARQVIDAVKRSGRRPHLTIKPSYDGVEGEHDEIRGVPGNFQRMVAVLKALKEMKPEAPFLSVEIGTIISRMNVKRIREIAEFGVALGVDSYRNEIAEQRVEMFNCDQNITPGVEDYESAVRLFKNELAKRMKYGSLFQRVTNAMRWVYYDIAVETLRTWKRVLPCYAGITNVHIDPYGHVWPCCVLGGDRSMGNLRDFDFDFQALWHGKKASEVRRFIKRNVCACPLANQRYSDMLLHTPTMLRVLKHVARVPAVLPNGEPPAPETHAGGSDRG